MPELIDEDTKYCLMALGGMMNDVKSITPEEGTDAAISAELIQSMIADMPLRTFINYVGQGEGVLEQFLNTLNNG